MKKRIFGILFVLCLLFCLVSTGVFAESETVKNAATAQEFIDALADSKIDTVRLTADIIIDIIPTVDRAVTLDLNGHVLRYFNEAKPFVSMNVTGDLTLKDSNPSAEHRFYNYYGTNLLILDEENGDRVINGGIITNLGIYIDGGSLKIDGGSIVGCQGGAGAIEVREKGAFTMNAGMIIGCYSSGAGALYVSNSTFTMTGGCIRENSANSVDDGAAIIGPNAVMNANGGEVSGLVVIEDGSKITCKDDLTGVTGFNGEIRVFYNSSVEHGIYYGEILLGNESCNISGITVTYKNGDSEYAKQVLKSGKKAVKPDDPAKDGYDFIGWYNDGAEYDFSEPVTVDITLEAKWTGNVKSEQELKDAIKDSSVLKIRLADNITLDSVARIQYDRELTLDLNGYILSVKEFGSDGIQVLLVYKSRLTIIDSRPDAEHRFTIQQNGLWKLDEENGTETVSGGIIYGGGSPMFGGGISATGGSTVKMEAGSIVGCVPDIGGSIFVGRNSTFTMTGGSIIGSAVSRGGGAYIDGSGTFILDGGVIRNCTAKNDGGGVCVDNGTFIFKSGLIKDCTSGYDGGAVCVYEKGTFTMTGGSVSECTAPNGSALYLRDRMNADGGEIDGTVVVDCSEDYNGIIKTEDGSEAVTEFRQAVINAGRIEYGIFYGDVTVGDESIGGGIISGGIFNSAVIVSNGRIEGGTFNGEVIVNYPASDGDSAAVELGNATYNELIRNNSINAKFSDASSELGIVGNEPNPTNKKYFKVTFDAAGGTLDDAERYFIDGSRISDRIEPASRIGFFFSGWYKGDTKWEHETDTVTENMTLVAAWTACTHTNHKGAQPTCTASATCTECGVLIPALGHEIGADYVITDTDHSKECLRCKEIFDVQPHADDNTDHICDTCGKVMSACEDADRDHLCDYCKKTVSDHEDADKDHICDLCSKVISSHRGGKASCKDKAVCEICGKAYGELDAGNHTSLKHVEAKAATKNADGNIEYWYCEDCDKYFADAKAENEITKADTVINKLPDEPVSPRTDDKSKLTFCLVLLSLSITAGAAVTGKRTGRKIF